ncbi:NUDIX hydrolase [Candidatus Daviesbacteria bacterium]|nr:NUDIX hydrolase [Candidatus Daviesbacteria bacterium]
MSSKVEKCDHASVGMFVWRDDHLLLIERKEFPFGFAPPAGHVDNHGSYEKAAENELKEEVGLRSVSLSLMIEGCKENICRRPGGTWHHWRIYRVEAQGNIQRSRTETRRAGWYSLEEIKSLSDKTVQYLNGGISNENWRMDPGIETVWYEWFRELKII